MKDLDKFYDELLKANIEASECPPPEMVIRFFEDILELLFPEFSYDRLLDKKEIIKKIGQPYFGLVNFLQSIYQNYDTAI